MASVEEIELEGNEVETTTADEEIVLEVEEVDTYITS